MFLELQTRIFHRPNDTPGRAEGAIYFGGDGRLGEIRLSCVNICMNMPFGKHRGREVHKLPRRYLTWLLKECDLYGPLKYAVEEALDKREYNSPNIEVPDIDGDLDNILCDADDFASYLVAQHTGTKVAQFLPQGA
jgi:Putative quorum-sensing-regulated virulence factor